MTVSMWGLWRFAGDQAQLPIGLRVAFIGILDGAEVGLFLGLFLAVRNGARQWTDPMRRSHRLAWALVALSAVAQVAEAETLWGKVAMGAVPILSAALIQHRLTAILATNRPADEDDDGGRPGPVRLVALSWRQLWTAVFDRLGLDAGATRGEQTRRAQVRRAVRLTLAHREALRRCDDLNGKSLGRRGRRSLTSASAAREKAAHSAARARRQAQLATNPTAQSEFVRGMAWATAGEELASINYQDTSDVIKLLDALNMIDTEALHDAERRLEDAQEAAEAARQDEATARKATERARQEAGDLAEEIRTAREETERARQEARTARRDEAAAREKAERAQEEERTARKDEAAAREVVETAQRELGNVNEKLTAAREKAQRAQEEEKAARREIAAARDEQSHITDDVQDRRAQAAALQEELTSAERQREQKTQEVMSLTRQADVLNYQITEAQSVIRGHESIMEQRATDRHEAEKRARAAQERREVLEAEAREARRVLAHLGTQIADQLGAGASDLIAELPAPGQPMHPKSPGMEAAWRRYCDHKRRGTAPTEPGVLARELAGLGGVAESRARAWIAEFRERYPRMIAAAALAERGRAEDAWTPGTAEQEGEDTEHSRAAALFPGGSAEQPAGPRIPQPSTGEQLDRANGYPVSA